MSVVAGYHAYPMEALAPPIPPVKMNLVRPNAPIIGTVVSNESCMHGKSASYVKHLEIDVSGTSLAGNFVAGQAFGVIAPGLDSRGKQHKVRLYSFACPSSGEDGSGNIISTTPKRLIDEYVGDGPNDNRLFLGVCSNYLCGLVAGDEVALTGPNGKRFLLPETPRDYRYLFVATGTGIAPIRGMIMELLASGASGYPQRIDLVMGVPYTTDLLYDEYFRAVAAEHDNFHYHTAISRESIKPGERGLYVDGLIEANMDLFAPILDDSRTLLYMCGLMGMQTGIYRLLERHNLTPGYVELRDELRNTPSAHWQDAQIKRFARPASRCFIEVY